MFVDFDDADLTDPQVIDVQIGERTALIDRLHGEIAQLDLARITATRHRGAR